MTSRTSPQLYISPPEAAQAFWATGNAPYRLVLQDPHGACTEHPWSALDSAMMCHFSADVVVQKFEATYEGYRHPRHALKLSEFFIRNAHTADIAEIRAMRKRIHRLARRNFEYLNSDRTITAALWSAANTAWCAEFVNTQRTDTDEKKNWAYSVNSVKFATEIDVHFAERMKLWLDQYLRMTAYLVGHSRKPEE